MIESRTESPTAHPAASLVMRWVVAGVLIGVILVLAFLAYGQPELLLEQMNLRYCG